MSLALQPVRSEDSPIESSLAPWRRNMQAKFFNQAFSFSLAALITVAVLAGIDHQAQPKAADQQLVQLVVAKA
jgi:hypothetical protein